MQYRHKTRHRVYTARSRRTGALKVLVLGIFAVSVTILLVSFCRSLGRQPRALQVMEPRLWCGAEETIYACDFARRGI